MALPVLGIPSLSIPNVGVHSVQSSVRSDWVQAHKSLTAAAASATNLKTPFGVTSANVVLMRVPHAATRVLIRGKYTTGTLTSMTTQPVVQVYSIFTTDARNNPPYTGGDAAPVLVTDGSYHALRIDATTMAAAGTTITLVPSTDICDSAYSYTDCPDTTGYDLKGGSYCMVQVKTAGVVNVGTVAVCELQALFIN